LNGSTGKVFPMAQKGKSIFQQSNASVDVTTLMNAWLKTVQDLQKKNRTDDAEFQKMKLLQIIYHGCISQKSEEFERSLFTAPHDSR
jgi:hypothetical protein